jgi:hypothetical protein
MISERHQRIVAHRSGLMSSVMGSRAPVEVTVAPAVITVNTSPRSVRPCRLHEL